MKKKITLIVLFVTFLTGCSNLEHNVEFDSGLFSDQTIVNELKSGEALFAFRINDEDGSKTQEIFIRDNLLRREVGADLLKILKNLDQNNNKVKKLSLDVLTLNKTNTEESLFSSILSEKVIEMLFPKEFNIANKTLYKEVMYMAIRLETLEEHGDTEVITLITKTKLDLKK